MRRVIGILGERVVKNAFLETQWYLFSAIFLLCSPYTLLRNEHIRIDVVAGSRGPDDDRPVEPDSLFLSFSTTKGITALAYKAALTMSMAETMQRRMGRVKSELMLRATADGGYPLSEQDIDWYLDFFN